MKDYKTKINELKERWLMMAKELNFEIITPYVLSHNEKSVECFAFLPHFGSINGMILSIVFPPDYETSNEISEICRNTGKYCSFINYETYINSNRQKFCETLIDWGYFGKLKDRPSCFDEFVVAQ